MLFLPFLLLLFAGLLLSCDFEEKYEDVLSNVTALNNATRKMKSSIKIRTIMETILALGNYINGSTSKGQCSAFRLDTLKTLPQTKGNDGKTTLLMFLVHLLDDEVLDLEDVANGTSEACKVTFKQVDEQVGALSSETKILTQEVKKTSNAPPSDSGDAFIKAMQSVAETIEKKTKQLNDERTKMKEAFNSFVSSFGEDPSKFGPEIFFTLWSTFFKNIEKACVANDKLEQDKEAKASKDSKKTKRGSVMPKRGGKGGGMPRGNPMAGMMGELAGKLKKRKN